MTKEEKQLLLKDLCVRLPYGVIVKNDKLGIEGKLLTVSNYQPACGYILTDIASGNQEYTLIEDVKPYLRPMSSMTEDERDEFRTLGGVMSHNVQNDTWAISAFTPEAYDWLNEHHFDYRIDPFTGKTLITSNLALEAPEGMYNKEESEKGSDIPVPKTVDEAISTLEKILSDDDREYLLENGAISMHDSLGRWIRNEWGLWTGSELKNELMNLNKGLNHPDDMSNYILEEFIKYWNNKL